MLLKVASKSEPSKVAGSLAASIKESGKVEMHAIGAGAVNQAVKAIAIARGFLAPMGVELTAIPSFLDITIGEEERTAIRFIVEKR